MFGKLVSGFLFGSVVLAGFGQGERWLPPGHERIAGPTMQGVRLPGARPWHPGGIPESAKRASHRDSGDPYEREDALLAASWGEFGDPSEWPEP